MKRNTPNPSSVGARLADAARHVTPTIATWLACMSVCLLVSSCTAAAPPATTGTAAAASSARQAPDTPIKPESARPMAAAAPSTQARPVEAATPASPSPAQGGSAPSSSNGPDFSRSNAEVTRASYATCIKAAGGMTAEMKRCMGNEYAYQDNRLNKAYQALIATMDDAQRSALRRDERAWLAYRKSHCRLDPSGGQAAELDAFDCSVQATARQATMLQDRLAELESRR